MSLITKGMGGQNPHTTKLIDKDHENMDAFLGYVLDYYKDGTIDKQKAIGKLAHVMTALGEGNLGEAKNWFEQGRNLILRD